MKSLLIIVVVNFIVVIIASLIEKYTNKDYVAYIVKYVKDVFGVATIMTSFWLVYCILC